MINLYNLHANPSQLLGYKQARTRVPHVAWDSARTPAAKKKLAHLWQQDADLAFLYAADVIDGAWPPGEAAIARNAQYAYEYARYVIEEPWPPGEAAIAQSGPWAYLYAHYVIGKPWPPGEAAIAQDSFWARKYAQFKKSLKAKLKS